MREYRKKYYDSQAQKPKDGMSSRSTVPKPLVRIIREAEGTRRRA